MNRKILFNDGWKFAKSSLEVDSCDKLQFKDIEIPHDWLIYNTLDLYENSIGWYKKKLVINKDLKDKEILLWFDGVYMNSTLYINNEYIGEWKYGYSSFEHNITKALKEGENEIILKVIHENPNSRWYSGAGIYRNVYLKIREENHIKTNGIYVVSKECDYGFDVNVNTSINISHDVLLRHKIIRNGEVVCESSHLVKKNLDNNSYEDTQKMFVESPALWSPDNPNLYELKSELYLLDNDKSIDDFNDSCELEENIKLIESINQRIGFKNVVFDHDKGLILNGTKIKINGVCEHHDLGALGSAFNKCALKRRFKILKEMGVNGIRTSHNMPAPELMDLADEMGFLVLSESFDMWERPKTTYDYARFFMDNYKRDVKSWIMRDRNHPCLFMWSIGNEIYDTHASKRGEEITKMLVDEVHKYDPCENGKVTVCSNYMPWENAQKCADIVKMAGYNYGEAYYDEHHEAHKDWIIYGSETASVVQSRGVYHFPYEKPILLEDDEQCSVLGNSCTSWGADSPESCIIDDRDAEYSLGQFIWTGFDYIGEPTPYHTKNSYFGQIDTAGFKKDSYYIYQAEWTDYKKKPMVHIFPYWDFNEGQIIDVRICSNAPLVELFVNDKCVGVHHIDHKHGKSLVPSFKVPYEKGEIKAVAYDEEGNVLCEDIRKSFGDPEEICLNCDKSRLIADGKDLMYLDISMKDKDGNFVYNAGNRVNVKVKGAGRLLGLDNGDSTDYDQYKGTSRRLFNGKLMAIIGSTFEHGNITVEVSSKGMEIVTKTFETIPSNNINNKSVEVLTKNNDREIVLGNIGEIPVRKIEISTNDGQTLDNNKKEIIVEANLYPENTSYKDVNWSIVSNGGIPTNVAKIEPYNNEEKNTNCHKAKITALGDGEFRVRCTSKNGSDKVRIISELEFKCEGLGAAHFEKKNRALEENYAVENNEVYGDTFKINDNYIEGIGNNVSLVFDNMDFSEEGINKIQIYGRSPIDKNTINILFEDKDGNKKKQLIEFIYSDGYTNRVFDLEKVKGIQKVTFVFLPGCNFDFGSFKFIK